MGIGVFLCVRSISTEKDTWFRYTLGTDYRVYTLFKWSVYLSDRSGLNRYTLCGTLQLVHLLYCAVLRGWTA